MMAHVSKAKKEIVKRMAALLGQYPIVGAVNMENLPAPQLQAIKAKLRGKIELVMTKRRLMKIAIGESKGKVKGIEQILPNLVGMPALLFTKENPFTLFRTLKKSRSKAPAKSGQIAPFDLVVNAGPTPFAPGPIIGELGALGIKTGVEAGKVVVKQDSTIAKKGDKINQKVADVLTRLDIKPMDVGLSLVAVLEDGVLYSSEVLDVDEVAFMARLQGAARNAVNLSVYAAYPTEDTVNIIIGKAHNDARALGMSQKIIDSGIVEEFLLAAERSALTIKHEGNIETVDKPKSEAAKIEEQKSEETKTTEVVKEQPSVQHSNQPAADKKKPLTEHQVVEALAKKLVKEGTLRKK